MAVCYQNQTFDAERALYHICDADIVDCVFDGPADGESALKECTNIRVRDCTFRLRYPLWHTHGGSLVGCDMNETCRAALWYDHDMTIRNCHLGGIKALRECDRMTLSDCVAESVEFGWLCRDMTLTDCRITSEYPFFQSKTLTIDRLEMKGKYSFQYTENVKIRHSVLDTKDAFWHAKNVTVEDSVLRGEYLAWYSEGLTLIRCKIIGTQPLCYAKDLTMIDCTMEGCDFSFENSTVEASIIGEVLSVRAPAGGHIIADSYGAILNDYAPVDGSDCEILVRGDTRADASDTGTDASGMPYAPTTSGSTD